MAENKKPEPDDKEQSARFMDIARKWGVDESGEQFEEAVKTISPPVPEQTK